MIDLHWLQDNQPWDGDANPYSRLFQNDERPHRDFEHALVHVLKSAGRLATLIEHEDHERRFGTDVTTPHDGGQPAFLYSRDDAAHWLADLVICAVRMARVYPGSPIDLDNAVIERTEEKNPTFHKTLVDAVASRRLR